MRTENEIRASLAEMERMATDAKRMLETNDTVKNSKVLTDRFTNWMIRSEARANILKWVLCLPYLEDQMTLLNSNEPGAVSSHEAEKVGCEHEWVYQPTTGYYYYYCVKCHTQTREVATGLRRPGNSDE